MIYNFTYSPSISLNSKNPVFFVVSSHFAAKKAPETKASREMAEWLKVIMSTSDL